MEIGKANYGDRKKKFKIEDGDNIYRIIPPIGQAAQKGLWNVYIALEWGFLKNDGKHFPFQDCRVKRNGMVEVESPAWLNREAIKVAKEDTIALFKEGKATEDQVKDAIALTKRFNLNKKYYLNVINQQGEIGLLPIGYKACQGIKEEIKALVGKGVDPLSVDQGRFFNIFRSGKGLETMYKVTIHQELVEAEVNGEKMTLNKDKVHVLDESVIGRLATEAWDLINLKNGYAKVTPDEVQLMLDGGTDAVSKIAEKYKKSAEPKAEPKNEVQSQTKADLKKELRSEAVADDKVEVKVDKKEEEKKEVKVETVSAEQLVQEEAGKKDDIDSFLAGLDL